MSLSAAPHAVRQGSQSDPEITATAAVLAAKCFRQYAPSVAKIPKYPLNPVTGDRCIAAIATVKSDRVDSAGLDLESIHRLEHRPMYAPGRSFERQERAQGKGENS